MSKILARVTRGRIRKATTNSVMVLALAGAMYFSGAIVTSPSDTGRAAYPTTTEKSVSLKDANKHKEEVERRRIEEEELIEIVKMCLKIAIL